ncbi:MAG: helix-turn-helix domain-containing protein [bacterium]|nr:MAG: helix-turn-helix domain-containing protein [bacterium]
MKEFFDNLKQVRQTKGLSLEEISRKSRLSLKYLEYIESGQFENLPKGYDRIFFKRYLKEIGEDKDEVWQDFNLFFGSGPLEKDLPYSSDIPPQEESPVEPEEESAIELSEEPSLFQKLVIQINLDKLHRYFWILITIIIVSAVGYFAYKQYIFVKNIPPEIKEISVSEYISEMQQQDSLLTPPIAKDSEISGTNNGEVQVELLSLERTWVREIRDQKDTTEYILIPGLKRKISAAENVKLMLGRADGVQIWANGDSLGVMGDASEVVLSLILDHSGIAEKRLKKPVERVPSSSDSISNPAEALSGDNPEDTSSD